VSLEGFVILAIVYFVLSRIAKAGKKLGAQIETARDQLTDEEPSETQEEEFSLAKVLREIERAKAEAGQARRAPTKLKPESEAQRLGRMQKALEASRRLSTPGERPPAPLGRMSWQSAETISEGLSLEVEERIVSFDDAATTRTARAEIDQDDQVQATIQRRLDAAAHRTREGREASYQAQQKAAAAAVASEALSAAAASSRLRRAIVWREILGPPVALRSEE
jgi:hypothetical protein